MLRLIQVGNSLPDQMPVDITAEFQPGMIGQLYLRGGKTVLGVSDGTSPYGIIDDVRTTAFSAAVVDEKIIVPNVPAKKNADGKWVTSQPVWHTLKYPNIYADSFVSRILDVELIPQNGVIIFPEETPLNLKLNESSSRPDSLRNLVSYTYQIANTPGDDSTLGSGKVTVWFHRGKYMTDQFDTTSRYPISGLLFVNEKGLLTTKRLGKDYPGVAMIITPPTMLNGGYLEFLWL